MNLEPGTRLGRYELVARIGRGGVGTVWEAVLHGPRGFRRSVALKLIHPGLVTTARQEALVVEARVGAVISHPNVVAVHDLGHHEGQWYVAMELVRGVTARDLVHTGLLGGRALVDLALQVCAGLAQIHETVVHEDGATPTPTTDGSTWSWAPSDPPSPRRPAGLVHRDIKPTNLLVDPFGVVKVADLGLAKLAPTARGGTPGYMAPEQHTGTEDRRADLFALGATLVHAVLGEPPDGDLDDTAREVLDASVPGLASIVARCLDPRPEGRYDDAHALATTLEAVASGARAGPTLAELVILARPDLQTAPGAAQRRTPSWVTRQVGNLPAPRDRFFGRDVELTRIAERLDGGDRLVTLKGPGGMGKTRLALAAAHRLRGHFDGGAWFLDVSEATDTSGLCAAVARALRLPLSGGDVVRQLGFALHARGRALFVLDNLEQVLDPAAEALGVWLGIATLSTWLCTSRTALRLSGERVVDVGPIDDDAATALFRDRVPRPLSDAELAEELPALVAALDRYPLALELAAARARTRSLSRLREALDARLHHLSTRDRDRPARHRSMHASLDASWDLLEPGARDALCVLAVFEGSFPFEAAEAVLADRGDGFPIDRIDALMDASLLGIDPARDHLELLTVIRQWARERAEPSAWDAARSAHGAYLCARVVAAGPAGGPRLSPWLSDLVAACRAAVARGDASVAAGTCIGVARVVEGIGPFALARACAAEVLAMEGLSPPERAEVLLAAADAARLDGDPQASLALCEQTLAGAPAPGTRVHALCLLAYQTMHLGDAETGHRLATRALEGAHTLGDARLEGRARAALGAVASHGGRIDEAEGHFVAALPLQERAGDLGPAGVTHHNLAMLYQRSGRLELARRHQEQALARFRDLGHVRHQATALGGLANLEAAAGDHDAALAHALSSVALCREVGDRTAEGIRTGALGVLYRRMGRDDEAGEAYQQAHDIALEVGNVRNAVIHLDNLGVIAMARGDLGGARRRFEEALARMEELRDLRGQAFALSHLGEVAYREGRADEGRDHLARAAGLAEREHLAELADHIRDLAARFG